MSSYTLSVARNGGGLFSDATWIFFFRNWQNLCKKISDALIGRTNIYTKNTFSVYETMWITFSETLSTKMQKRETPSVNLSAQIFY